MAANKRKRNPPPSNVSPLFGGERSPEVPQPVSQVGTDHRDAVRRSAVWAAYGDALGFPSELVDAAGLRRRIGTDRVTALVPWSRRVGGRSGVTMSLPAGAYSDDTQLRLASGRCISANGFDVEAFAKVELAVWPAYALGAGRGTKAAAAAISRVSSTWYSNVFPGWQHSGGNGAAMRIQPHVWSSLSPDPAGYLPAVMRNAMCTHSHPVGMVGAGLHAITLARALHDRKVPEPDAVAEALDALRLVPQQISDELEGSMWRQLWEADTGADFSDEWDRVLGETKSGLLRLHRLSGSSSSAYEDCLSALDLRSDALKGAGSWTALAACWLAWSTADASTAIVLAANALGSDTDSIATMVGALLGPSEQHMPPEQVQDHALIVEEADRLVSIGAGERVRPFRYPDLLGWNPPQSQGDVLGEDPEGNLVIRGLGPCVPAGDGVKNSPNGDFAWLWVRTHFGQSVLIKRRAELPTIPPDQLPPVPRSDATAQPVEGEDAVEATVPTIARQGEDSRPIMQRPMDRGLSLDSVFRYLAEEPITDQRVGYAMARVARDGTNDDMRQFVGTLREMLRSARQ